MDHDTYKLILELGGICLLHLLISLVTFLIFIFLNIFEHLV
jgi:hypothetical protein